jgi:acetoin:2,6-dichlorophenolindophenol oxidoreductase subunit alpha
MKKLSDAPSGIKASFYDRFDFNPSSKLDLYRMMLFIRKFEEKLLHEYGSGKISGTTHTCIGQEANAVAIISCLDRSIDSIWSNHRCHGHFLSYCGDAYSLFSEILAKKNGVCGGRGGSQHLAHRNFFSSGIQGGLATIAVGAALADKGKGALSVVFLGDGTMGQGNIYEALNMASLWNIPVLFVVEDNAIAQTTEKHLSVAGDIRMRAEAFGVESQSIASTDIFNLTEAASNAVSYVRHSKKPFWLHIETSRLMAHSKGDDTRDPDAVAKLWHTDCLAQATPDQALKAIIEEEITAYVAEAFNAAWQGEDACA